VSAGANINDKSAVVSVVLRVTVKFLGPIVCTDWTGFNESIANNRTTGNVCAEKLVSGILAENFRLSPWNITKFRSSLGLSFTENLTESKLIIYLPPIPR
jgi:hypothetical protein